MIDPKEVQAAVRGTLLTCGDMLVGTVRTYELACGAIEEERIQHYIKDELARELGHHLVGKSFVEHSKHPYDYSDEYTGRVLVIPYLELDTAVAEITSKIIEELNNGNHLVLPN